MKTMKMRWVGIRPLLMHNGNSADAMNPLVREIKKITNKGSRKMTDSDLEARDFLEWKAGLYYDEQLGPYIPSDNVERCIQIGAQKSRKGKDVAAAVFVAIEQLKDGLIPLDYVGPRDIEKLYADKKFQLRKGVKVQQSRIIRTRPLFPVGWSIIVPLEYDESIVNEETLVQACVDAGALAGLGDWRPKFGRFLVELAK